MTASPSERIGPYRILDTLGEGGMGVVYLAEQEVPVRRKVAVKVLAAGGDSEPVLARFDAERQALAVMDHPCIAKIFDAGVTSDGRPYFAMEFVTGAELADFCDERRLSVRERVALFVDLCHGVQHAHQKGVIHRDLKPSNIIVAEVDGRPLPRIIDFGIAKAVGGGDFDGAGVTRADQIVGTPAYMSPEQIDGSADVDTRTDVYALGVILYEILVGALPFERQAYRGWAAVASLMQGESPTLVRRLEQLSDTQDTLAGRRSTTPGALRRELSGDLGWIARRAMERDRELRYETVSALGLDLQRYLDGEPVRARAASRGYVLRKFVARNRLGVAFAGSTVLGLVAFSAVTSIQADRVERARDEALARRAQAEGLIQFMLSDLREKLEPIGRLEILDDVGDEALAYFASIPETEFSEGELLLRSQALYQIGSVWLNQGNLGEARTAFSESLRLSRALTEREPDNTDWLFGRSQSHFWVGYAAWLQRDLAEAEAQFAEYLRIAESLVARDGSNDSWRLELAYALSNIGSVREERRDLEGALVAFRANLATVEELRRGAPEDPGLAYDLAVAHNKVGVVLRKAGDLAGARDEFAANLEVTMGLAEADPSNAVWADATGLSHLYLGEVMRLQGDLSGALAEHRAQERVFERLVRLDSENIEWAASLGIARREVGGTLLDLGDRAGARAMLASSRTILDDLVRRDPDRLRFPRASARARWIEARMHLGDGRLEEALTEARASAALLVDILERDAQDQQAATWLGESRLLEGDVLSRVGQDTEAATAWQDALLRTEGAGTQADVLDLRARALERLGRVAESEAIRASLELAGYHSPELATLSPASAGRAR